MSLLFSCTGYVFLKRLLNCPACMIYEKCWFQLYPSSTWHENKLSLHQQLPDFDGDALKFWVSPSHALALTSGWIPFDEKWSHAAVDEGSLEGPEKEERWGRIWGVFPLSSVVQTNWDTFLTWKRKRGWARFQRLDFHISDLSFTTSFHYFNSYFFLSCLLISQSVPCHPSCTLIGAWLYQLGTQWPMTQEDNLPVQLSY